MGKIELDHTGSGSGITLSSDGTNLLLGGTAIGGGGGGDPDLYRDNAVSATTPTASGNNAVAIGTNAQATNTNAVALTRNALASGNSSFAAGNNAAATGTNAVALGSNTDAEERSVAIGSGSQAVQTNTTAIGTNSSSQAPVAGKFGGGAGAVALGGSYSAGTDSFAAAISNNTSSYGASGDYSVAIGRQAKATGGSAVALNYQAIASGYGSVSTGQNSNASASYSTVIGGRYGEANEKSKVTFGGGNWLNDGGAVNLAHQTGLFNLAGFTTDGTAKALTTYDSTASSDNQVVLPNNSAYAFSGTIVAREKASEGTDCAAWEIKGLIRREGNAGTTVLVNSATTVLDNTPNWGLALSADTTNGCLKVAATGAASTNIRWAGTITTSELTYA